MKKILLLLLALPTMLVAQRKVAVFVTGTDKLDNEVKEILASELTTTISQSRDYQAVEYSNDFSRELQGSQDNEQICALGRRLGVDLVCVANVSSFRDSYYIKSRLLDVRSLAIVSSSSEGSQLATIEDILNVTERLMGQLFYSAAPIEEEFSKIGAEDPRGNCYLISIDNTGDNTVATFKLLDAKGIRWSLSGTTVIRDRATGNEYKLLSTNGIVIHGTAPSETYGIGIHAFTATFEKLPYNVTNIDIEEPKGWIWTDILLKNYGKTGYHVFVDETQRHFDRLMKEQAFMRQQEAKFGPITNVVNTARSILITINNEQYSDFLIELNGKKIGRVAKRSTMTFRVAPEDYGQLKAIQIDFLISPQVFKYQVPPMKPTEQITFNILRP